MYKVFDDLDPTNIKSFRTLKDVHKYLVDEYNTKTTYGQLLQAMQDYNGQPCLYFDFFIVYIKRA